MYNNNNDFDIRLEQFKKLLDRAKGYNTITNFLDSCNVDPVYIGRLFTKKTFNFPDEESLKTIATKSNNKVSHSELMRVCGHTLSSLKPKSTIEYHRGDIFYIDLGEGVGSEQAGKRPCVVIQNDTGNKYSPTIIIAPVTKQIKGLPLLHVSVGQEEGLSETSIVLLEQIRTVDKLRVKGYIGHVTDNNMDKINKAYKISGGVYGIFDEIDCDFKTRESMNRIDRSEKLSLLVGLKNFISNQVFSTVQ